jgi:hypothetical protein
MMKRAIAALESVVTPKYDRIFGQVKNPVTPVMR